MFWVGRLCGAVRAALRVAMAVPPAFLQGPKGKTKGRLHVSSNGAGYVDACSFMVFLIFLHFVCTEYFVYIDLQ